MPAKIFHQFGVDTSRLQKEMERSLDKLKSGNARTPAISPSVFKMLTEGWTVGSIDFGATQIRSGHAVLALLENTELARIARDIGKELQKIQPELLRKDFIAIVEGTQEDTDAQAAAAAPSSDGAPSPRAGGKTPNLDQFTVDLTGNARKGKIDPVLARAADHETDARLVSAGRRGRRDFHVFDRTVFTPQNRRKMANGAVSPQVGEQHIHIRAGPADPALDAAGRGSGLHSSSGRDRGKRRWP